jgi:GT2 family glycosyltransferase
MVALSAAENAAPRRGGYEALSEAPWLRIDFDDPPPAGRWIRMTYVSGLLDPLARPLLRCFAKSSHHDELLPGALFGRSIWIGLIPESTREIWISPTNRRGFFSFAIECIEMLSTPELVWRCFQRSPRLCATGVGAHVIGLHYAAETAFRRALAATKLRDYHEWRKLRLRDLDLKNLDAPRSDWTVGPRLRFLVHQNPGDERRVRRLAADLAAQAYPHWTLAITSSSMIHAADGPEAPILTARPSATIGEVLEDLADRDLVAPMTLGDEIPAYAVAVLAEAAAENPNADVFYGDEDFIDADGRYAEPRLKPDWSPDFCSAAFYLGAAFFFRVGALRRDFRGVKAADLALDPSRAVGDILQRSPSVVHLRRVLRTRAGAPPSLAKAEDRSLRNGAQEKEGGARPRATIIIPTKDRRSLLEGCINRLRATTRPEDVETLVVDNGSVQEDARRYLGDLALDPDVRIFSRPGPFNFSKLCNDAAKEAKAPILVFLNNDVEALEVDWLEPLLYWARQGDVGAVGAKLLYPSGRVQHAGVTLGVDGRAGHIERLLDGNDPGYFGRLRIAHEVSAVTAACLAVEKSKFAAVGGFDAVNLPVDLNDVDLCLRLAERGWKSICASDSRLVHHEAASRGATLRPDELYRSEHLYFRAKWMFRLRDDPFFHPALSLASLDPSLG